jgi:hypothetical protein
VQKQEDAAQDLQKMIRQTAENVDNEYRLSRLTTFRTWMESNWGQRRHHWVSLGEGTKFPDYPLFELQ